MRIWCKSSHRHLVLVFWYQVHSVINSMLAALNFLFVLYSSYSSSVWNTQVYSAMFYSSLVFFKFVYCINFFVWLSKKYNFAISVFFGNLSVKQLILLISSRITSLYLLFVVKNSPQISTGCFWSSVVEIIGCIKLSGTFIWKFKLICFCWFYLMTISFGK